MSLALSQVDVWRANLDLPPDRIESLSQILSSDERARSSRFRYDLDRDRFVVSHAALRILLARYLRTRPSAIEFSCNEFGKPGLSGNSGRELQFNLSHSGTLALFAFARAQVGVDIERIRPEFATEQIAERFFSPDEVRSLRALPTNLQAVGFFNCWTRKEAYIKAWGQGLSMPLRDFTVSLRPGDPAALLSHANQVEISEWSLRELPAPEPYVAAMAVRLKEPMVNYRQVSLSELQLSHS